MLENGKIILDIPEELEEKLKTIASFYDGPIEDLLLGAIESAVRPFCSYVEAGDDLVYTVNPQPGIYLSGATEYEKKVAEIEGREIVIEEKPCTILEKTSVFGAPYYRIYLDGQLMKVPAVCIKEM